MIAAKRGFTLVELLVVIGIIALIASIVLSSLQTARAKARDSKRVQDIKEVQKAVELHYAQNGYYPRACPDPLRCLRVYDLIIEPGELIFVASCWECYSTGYRDTSRLVAINSYLNPRPADPLVPPEGYFGEPGGGGEKANWGYWYGSSPGDQPRDYKIFLIGSIENETNIPLRLRHPEGFTGRSMAISSSDNSREWQFTNF